MDSHCKNPKPNLPRWNWGAFLLTWIWGVGNRVWISLFALIPGVNFIMAIYLGFKGNDLAYRRAGCPSKEEFLKTQKQWLLWGVIIVSSLVVLSFLSLLTAAYFAEKSDEIEARDAQRIVDVRVIASRLSHYLADHSDQCPENLQELLPDYMESLPLDPNGQGYGYRIEGKECYISSALEDKDNPDLKDDSDPSNGRVFDQKAEDLNNYMFDEE